MEMPSSVLQETEMPTSDAAVLLHGATPAAGAAPGSALLATFPRKHFAVHVHKLQVGEKEYPEQHWEHCFTLTLLNSEAKFVT